MRAIIESFYKQQVLVLQQWSLVSPQLDKMNTFQPVPSSLDSVQFSSLSADEIRALSVKRIENNITFDNLLHPVPGGLYDPALGALDNYLSVFSFLVYNDSESNSKLPDAQHAI
jgi:hypothetical protein